MAGILELHPTLWRTARVLGGRTRLGLLRRILEKPGLGVTELAAREGLGESRASQELRRLQSRGLVRAIRTGRKVCYWPLTDPQVPSAQPLLEVYTKIFARHPRFSYSEGVRLARAFSHPRRLSVTRELLRGPRGFRALSNAVGGSRASLHRHLRVLRACQLVERRGGRYRWKHDPHPLARCFELLMQRESAFRA